MPLAKASAHPLVAFWLESDSQKACEIARLAGFDMVVFDLEHGVLDLTALDRLLPYCQSLGLGAYVRLAEATRAGIQQALDIGGDGVILPQIRGADHAEAVSALSKFPPLGTRGVGYSRTQRYQGATDAFFAAENRNRACYVMIETAEALAEVEQIAALPTVDGLFLGPADLSATRGRGAFAATDADIADMARIATAATGRGKLWALAGANPTLRAAALPMGPAFVTVGDDLSALAIGFGALRKACN